LLTAAERWCRNKPAICHDEVTSQKTQWSQELKLTSLLLSLCLLINVLCTFSSIWL
jgi:hypothetical protein